MHKYIPLIGFKSPIRSGEFQRIFDSMIGKSGYFSSGPSAEVTISEDGVIKIRTTGPVLGFIKGKFFMIEDADVSYEGVTEGNSLLVYYRLNNAGTESEHVSIESFEDYEDLPGSEDDYLLICRADYNYDSEEDEEGLEIVGDSKFVDGPTGSIGSGGSVDEVAVANIIADILGLKGKHFGGGKITSDNNYEMYLDGKVCMITEGAGLVCAHDIVVGGGNGPKDEEESSFVILCPDGSIEDYSKGDLEGLPGWPDEYVVIAEIDRDMGFITDISEKDNATTLSSGSLVVTKDYIDPKDRQQGYTYFVYGDSSDIFTDRIPYRVKPDMRLKKVDSEKDI